MAGSTFIQVPQNIEEPQQMRRFLDKLVQQLDVAFGNRGDEAFVTTNGFLARVNTVAELISAIQDELLDYSKTDGTREFTAKVSYNSPKSFVSGSNELVDVNYVETNYEPKITKNTAFNKDFGIIPGTVTEGGTTTNNPTQGALPDLNQTISNPPTQAEVQAISNKVDSILNALRASNIISV